MVPRRLAAIDIGTNSIRCIVAEARQGNGYRVLDDEKATVRLGEGLAATGCISPAAWERAREALVRMKQIAEGLGAEMIEAVATSAVRKAANGGDFAVAMGEAIGLPIRVISGREEAELAVLSARSRFALGSSAHALVDIGGGSVELVFATGELVEEVCSLELGAVLLTETFRGEDPPGKKDLVRLRRHIRQQLESGIDLPERFSLQDLVGSGGTMTSIASMLIAERGEPYDSVAGYEVLRADVVHLLARLQRSNAAERRAIPGLNPERADIIVAGVTLVDEIMDLLDVNLLRINAGGIREGLILKALGERGLEGEKSGDWRQGIDRLLRVCHCDLRHSSQVRELALAIFDAVAPGEGLDGRSRDLLEAAALLHDIGYAIGYHQHHKHSYHLIRHADLFDFSPREREIVANIARYHRKSLPKKKHVNFTHLAAADRDLVRRLGGIVRLADGLDRRRAAMVTASRCVLSDSELRVVVSGTGNLAAEIHGGQVKSDLFEAAFGRKVLIEAAS